MKYTHEDQKLNKYLDCAIYIIFIDGSTEYGILRKNKDSYKLECYEKDVVFYKSHIKAIYYNGSKIYKGR